MKLYWLFNLLLRMLYSWIESSFGFYSSFHGFDKNIKYLNEITNLFRVHRSTFIVIEFKAWCIKGNRIHCNEMNYSMGVFKCKTSDNFARSFPSHFSRFTLNFRWNLKFGKLLRLPSCTFRNRSLRTVFSLRSFFLCSLIFCIIFIFIFTRNRHGRLQKVDYISKGSMYVV